MEKKHGFEISFNTFYFSYVFEFVVNFFRYWNIGKAYRNISYEKEAYGNEKKVKLARVWNDNF